MLLGIKKGFFPCTVLLYSLFPSCHRVLSVSLTGRVVLDLLSIAVSWHVVLSLSLCQRPRTSGGSLSHPPDIWSRHVTLARPIRLLDPSLVRDPLLSFVHHALAPGDLAGRLLDRAEDARLRRFARGLRSGVFHLLHGFGFGLRAGFVAEGR